MGRGSRAVAMMMNSRAAPPGALRESSLGSTTSTTATPAAAAPPPPPTVAAAAVPALPALPTQLQRLLDQASALDCSLAQTRRRGQSRAQWETVQSGVEHATRQSLAVDDVRQLAALVAGLFEVQYGSDGRIVVGLPSLSEDAGGGAAVGSAAWLVARRTAVAAALRAYSRASPGAPLPTPPPLAAPPAIVAAKRKREEAASIAAAPAPLLLAASRRCPVAATKVNILLFFLVSSYD